MEKLYCYVDETGQDTQGRLFIVVAVVAGRERDGLEDFLVRSEEESGRGRRKWHRSAPRLRERYLCIVFGRDGLAGAVYYRVFSAPDGGYLDMTAEAVDMAVRRHAAERGIGRYRVVVVVDALNDEEQRRMRRSLSRLGLRSLTVRGHRDESSALLRLADTAAGLIRDAEEGSPAAIREVGSAAGRGILLRLGEREGE